MVAVLLFFDDTFGNKNHYENAMTAEKKEELKYSYYSCDYDAYLDTDFIVKGEHALLHQKWRNGYPLLQKIFTQN